MSAKRQAINNGSMNTLDLKSFHYLENGDIQFSVFDTEKSTKILDAGFHELEFDGNRGSVTLKQLLNIEHSNVYDFRYKGTLDNLFDAFFDQTIMYKINNLGFKHKVGVLLYGKEGGGKSTIIKHYCNEAINKHEALVFYLTKNYLAQTWDFIRSVRNIQANPIIVIFEEFDSFVQNEPLLKLILDGNLSIDNVIFFGATNYLEFIPNAIKDRPSRFKYVLEIEGIDDEAIIEGLLNNMIGEQFTVEEINDFAKTLNGKTLDVIKQFALDKIMDIKEKVKGKTKIGFVNYEQ